MRTRRATCALALAAASLTVAGCAQAKDAVQDAANSAASSAASQAAEIPRSFAREQLCKIVADGKISESESKSLNAAVTAAEKAGVPKDITNAARQVASDGTAAPRKAVADLEQKCAAA